MANSYFDQQMEKSNAASLPRGCLADMSEKASDRLDMPQCAAGPWLPMSEAPKDGTNVLLLIKENICGTGCFDDFAPLRGWVTGSGWVVNPVAFAYINLSGGERMQPIKSEGDE